MPSANSNLSGNRLMMQARESATAATVCCLCCVASHGALHCRALHRTAVRSIVKTDVLLSLQLKGMQKPERMERKTGSLISLGSRAMVRAALHCAALHCTAYCRAHSSQ
jgi:hypothetical protein